MSCSADDGIANSVTANFPAEPTLPITGDRSPLLVGKENRDAVARRGKIVLAGLYALQVFYSFFIM